MLWIVKEFLEFNYKKNFGCYHLAKFERNTKLVYGEIKMTNYIRR